MLMILLRLFINLSLIIIPDFNISTGENIINSLIEIFNKVYKKLYLDERPGDMKKLLIPKNNATQTKIK